VEKIRENYRQICGKSPLLEITKRQVSAVQAQFDPSHYCCYIGMHHWPPWIEDAVRELHCGHIEFAHVESYHDAPGLIQALAC
jgi:protoheme ferro-lyase